MSSKRLHRRSRLFGRIVRIYGTLFGVGLIALPLYAASDGIIKLRAVTSPFPPLQMLEEGKPGGYAVSILESLIKKVAQNIEQPIEFEIEFLPWNRAFRTTSSDLPNILFFSLARSPARENLFQWVGKISPYDIQLFSINPDLQADLQTLEAIRDSDRIIAVQGGSNVEEHLLTNGFVKDRDFITVADYPEGIKMLYRHRIDYVPMTSFLARGNVCNEGLDPGELVESIRLENVSRPLWLVFSLATDVRLVEEFSDALEAINLNTKYEDITQSHIDQWTAQICDKPS